MEYFDLLFYKYLKGVQSKGRINTNFSAYVNGTEQLLPVNTSAPATTPFLGDIRYSDGYRNDQYFTYRESPTTVDGLAKIKDIKGNTLVWNQQVVNGDFSGDDISLWVANSRMSFALSNNSLVGTVTNAGSSSQYIAYRMNGQTKGTHKYYMALDVTPSVNMDFGIIFYNTNVGVNVYAIDDVTANVKARVSHIFEATLTGDAHLNICLYAGAITKVAVGESFTIDNFFIVDLTRMFGAGNEPATAEEFASLYPLPYYQYDSGSLLSFNGSGIKTTGKNLLPNKTYDSGNIFVGSDSDDYNIWLNAGTYTFTRNVNENCGAYYRKSDGNANIAIMTSSAGAGIQSRTFTVAENGFYRFWLYKSGGIDLENVVYFQLEHGSTATDYEPYTGNTTNLPVATYFPTGMKSAGSVYDELTPTKAITRVGSVDLGTLTWTYNSTYQAFYSTQIKDLAKRPQPNEVPNMTSIFTPRTMNSFTNPVSDMSVYYNTLGDLWIRNTAYTDATTFKSAMSGVYLYYELATPTETDVSEEAVLSTYNKALSTILGKTVSVNNPQEAIDIITKGE